MCKFFSLVSDGAGNVKYFDAEQRKLIHERKLMAGTNPIESPDSHSSLAAFYKLSEDKWNKWEYCPVTQQLVRDQINKTDDFVDVEKFCKELDFKTVVPELKLHPLVHALKVKRKKNAPSKREVELLRQWASPPRRPARPGRT